MPTSDLERVIVYHDATKHHPGRYARSPGDLDWANQPNPFRRFAAAPVVTLPLPGRDDSPPYDDLFRPGRIARTAFTLNTLSRFLECSLAISAWKQAGGSRWALRCNPSSGNLHPTEGYLILPALEGVADRPGVHHYAPREHVLERRAALTDAAWEALCRPFPGGLFFAGLSSVLWRETWKYGERAFRYCQHDVGHALAALQFAAASLGWRLVMLEGLSDGDVAALLGLDRAGDFRDAEPEHPDLLAVVVPDDACGPLPRDVPDDAIGGVAGSEWAGRANRLSREHVEWEIIDMVADAAARPRTNAPPAVADPATPGGGAADRVEPACPHSFRRIARQRRSALGFDGRTGMSREAFDRLMTRVTPASRAGSNFWRVYSWRPAIHFVLFVHRVEGLTPGLYILAREATAVDRLRAACSREFEWRRPEGCAEGLSLYLLKAADCRRAAAQLSLGQEIAGTSAFSLGMLADFESSLRQHGAWFYRRLFWEAGYVGQVLYLEAEAVGLRATGIGAYFDDLVHAVLGLEGRAFQSLYHFTVGAAIDDPRLTSLPAYPAPPGETGAGDAP